MSKIYIFMKQKLIINKSIKNIIIRKSGLKIMKSKKIFFGLMLLSLFILSNMLSAQAAVYNIGVAENDEFIYEVTTVEEDGLEAVFGADWASYLGPEGIKGVKEKFIITTIKEETTYWKITSQHWDPTTAAFSEYPDSSAYYMNIYKDPDDAGYVFFFVPTPVSSYLAVIAGKYTDVKSSGNTITYDFDFIKTGLDWEITFNNDGVMTSWAWVYVGKTIWELTLGGLIPGYDLAILLGISAVSMLSIIYIVMKKKK